LEGVDVMDKELVAYYEDRFSMCCEKGWKDLMDDLDKMIQARDRLSGVADEKSLNFAKGELSIMNWLKTLEDVSRAAYEQLNKEENDAPI
jgi:hypothetical protein